MIDDKGNKSQQFQKPAPSSDDIIVCKDTPQSNTDWEQLITLFGATELEAKFLAKILSNNNVSETILDIRQLLEAEKKRWVEEVENELDKHIAPHPLSLEDSVWLKRLLNKVFQHEQRTN